MRQERPAGLYEIRSALGRGLSIFDLDLRVTYYARVSTDKDEQLHSLKAQIDYYADFIRANPNWTFVEGYVDATVIIGLKQNPTIGRRFSPIFSFFEHLSGKYGRCYT